MEAGTNSQKSIQNLFATTCVTIATIQPLRTFFIKYVGIGDIQGHWFCKNCKTKVFDLMKMVISLHQK